MKVLTILGTRPEIIRLSRIIPKLDACTEHVLVHTGQNYDKQLSGVFFKELGVREPNYNLHASGTPGEQIGKILSGIEEVLIKENPDRFLVLGDTNSSLAAIVAKRRGIPVFHMEAGNRCYDDRSPEEVNRRIIDHSSDVLMPYTERSRQNLLAEGIAGNRILVTGNPIHEVIRYYPRLKGTDVLDSLGLRIGNYFLVTLHREENVDEPNRLVKFFTAFDQLKREYDFPVIVSTHPRTRSKIGSRSTNFKSRLCSPFGFSDFQSLLICATCVLTDSGTVQEECCIHHVPAVILRDSTERPETIECGASALSGADPERIVQLVKQVMSKPCDWNPPPEYMRINVSDTVVNIITRHYQGACR